MGNTCERFILGLALAGILTSCAAPPVATSQAGAEPVDAAATYPADRGATEFQSGTAPDAAEAETVEPPPAPEPVPGPERIVRIGSGNFVGEATGLAAEAEFPAGDVTLNFESADLQEVVKTIFEDILKENYQLDPNVRGTVTMHTTMPVARESVLPILESILQSNGAVLVRGEGLYKVVPAGVAGPSLAAPTLGRTPAGARSGYGVQVVPLRYVAAAEMKKILDPFAVEPAKVDIDEARNLVLLSGPRANVNNLLETVKIFDVDWFQGMSFGLFPVKYADVEVLSEEITQVLDLGEGGALSGIVKLIPITRLNALLAVTHQPKHLRMVAEIVDNFDRGTQAGPERRLFIYNLQYAEAQDIAGTLQDIFEQQGETVVEIERGSGGPAGAPGETVEVRARNLPGAEPLRRAPDAAAGATPASGVSSRAGGVGETRSPVSIKADTKSNALIVLASPADYRAVESAIARLDVPQRQVLIEATIAEVALTDNLSYGVRWFFEWGLGGSDVDLGFGAPLPGAVGGEGLSLGIFNSAGEMRVFFDILGAETKVEFLSAPQVVVVDNETANFRVGDSIPVVTRASQSTSSPDAPVVSEVEYRDTGTLLSVKPRINAGGVVALEINQEVSVPGTSASGGNPPISQRTITTSVVVESGQTVVLGGLIRENNLKSKSGIPVLMNLPVLGFLFSGNTDDTSRTELIITVTPRVIKNPYEYRLATDELRRRVQRATAVEQSVPH